MTEPFGHRRCFSLLQPNLLFLGLVHFLHRLVHVFVRLFHRIEFLLLLRCEQRTDLCAGAFHDRPHLLHRFLMDGFDLRFRLIDDGLHLDLLLRGKVQALAEMLERIPHMMIFRAGFACLKVSQTAERESAGGHESDKFFCHCFVCYLFFSAIRAPLSRMDDRNRDVAVTGFFWKKFLSSQNRIYSVTSDRAALSSCAVWTCFALHG